MNKLAYLKKWMQSEIFPGLLLLFATGLALFFANSASFRSAYQQIWNTPFIFKLHHSRYCLPALSLWVNDGLMVLFFLLASLEIKYEWLHGHLSTMKTRTLPIFTTIGGVLVPACIYLMLNIGEVTQRGWAIPTATDIAFSLSVLRLVGRPLPKGLWILLMSIAVLDDLCAILIIGLFYSQKFSALGMTFGLFFLWGLWLCSRRNVQQGLIYFLLGLGLFFSLLEAGIHVTLSGVLVGFCMPIQKSGTDIGNRVEHALRPWIAYFILPVFAFANAGVSIQAFNLQSFLTKAPLGVFLGLLLGKQLGVFLAAVLCVYFDRAKLPASVSWIQLYGGAVLCGIGFTMSLFIAELAFPELSLSNEGGGIKLSILLGSFFSALLGWGILRWSDLEKTKV